MNRLPLKVNWRITWDCDNWRPGVGYRCVYCYSPENHVPPGHQKRRAEWRDVAHVLRTRGAKIAVLTGGEPTSHPQLADIVDYLVRHDIQVNLSTNGRGLRRALPDYLDDLAVLALPLDGPTDQMHNKFRRDEEGHFQIVMQILDEVRERRRLGGPAPDIKIATVLGESNSRPDVLESIGSLLANRGVSIWKLFEYNYYPGRQSAAQWEQSGQRLRSPFDFTGVRHSLQALGLNVKYFPADERTDVYFMIDPDGEVVIPKLDGDEFSDRECGNLVFATDKAISAWWQRADIEKHFESVDRYETTYTAFRRTEGIRVIRKAPEVELWDGVSRAGVSAVFAEKKALKYRRIDGRDRPKLVNLLQCARNTIRILGHLMPEETTRGLREFILTTSIDHPEVRISIALPRPKSPLAELVSRSRPDPIGPSYESALVDTLNKLYDVREELRRKGREATLDVLTVEAVIPYASVVQIDDRIVQLETKFPLLEEDRGIILQYRDPSPQYRRLSDSMEVVFKKHVAPYAPAATGADRGGPVPSAIAPRGGESVTKAGRDHRHASRPKVDRVAWTSLIITSLSAVVSVVSLVVTLVGYTPPAGDNGPKKWLSELLRIPTKGIEVPVWIMAVVCLLMVALAAKSGRKIWRDRKNKV